jgi:hypothetical protein
MFPIKRKQEVDNFESGEIKDLPSWQRVIEGDGIIRMQTRSPGGGGNFIKYKQRWDGVKTAVSNTGNIEVRCIEYKRFVTSLPFQIQAAHHDVGG